MDVPDGSSPASESVRSRFGIDASETVILYTGTFEPYQGLDLLIGAAARLSTTHPGARVLAVGGNQAQVSKVRARADGVAPNMIFTGHQPPAEIPEFVQAADILVSPRIRGTNTPLKLYSYLRSGRPIVATDLRTHTQVLDERIALLVPPQADTFAEAIGRLIDQPAERHRLAEAARTVASTRYSRDGYVAKTAEAYARLLSGLATRGASSSDSGMVRSKVS